DLRATLACRFSLIRLDSLPVLGIVLVAVPLVGDLVADRRAVPLRIFFLALLRPIGVARQQCFLLCGRKLLVPLALSRVAGVSLFFRRHQSSSSLSTMQCPSISK